LSNQVVDKLNEKKDSMLKGEITKDAIMLKTNKALIEYNVLADAIELTFKPNDTKSALKTSATLIKGLNAIIEINESLLDKVVNFKYWAVYVCLVYCVSNNKIIENDNIDVTEVYKQVLSGINIEEIEIKSINKNSIKHIVEMIDSTLNNNIKAQNTNDINTEDGETNE
jgi:hypothetical protein